MNKENPEILAPAGDFNSAIHALKSGADAVYLGLTSFSARKRATNFTLEEVRRLKTFSFENNKKIYVAINTLLKDIELDDLYPVIKELEQIKVDAVIVQDLGLAKIINDYTTLTIHASTQLAIHNTHGIKVIRDLGFKRAVLSRELSLDEIIRIKEFDPEMELEIFIHGALCYGFSGLCLASSKLLGRSANRGECGQICRTWFNNNGKKEYCFSLNDLSLQEKVLKLKEIGIDSLKIEGRMKGPGYASITSKLYYEILNGLDYAETLKKSKIEFNRSGHDAYLTNAKGRKNINSEYPGHMGIEIGEIISIKDNTFIIKVNESIENRDGLMILNKNNTENPYRFAANIQGKNGNSYTLKGTIPSNLKKTVYKVSGHNRHLKEEKISSYKPWKSDITINISILNHSIIISAENIDFTYQFETSESRNPINLKEAFNKSFYPGGESQFHFPVKSIENRTNFNNPFIPGSKIKEIRNSFQKEFIKNIPEYSLPKTEQEHIEIKPYIKNTGILPFATDFNTLNIDELHKFDGKRLLPLTPVIFNSEKYLIELKKFIDMHQAESFIIGLNNISHLAYIKELSADTEYYADYGIYALNNYSIKLLKSKVPNLKWVTKWVESDKESEYPPIFISRTCFKAQQNGCPENCPKSFEFNISQKSNQLVVVRNCISYTIIK